MQDAIAQAMSSEEFQQVLAGSNIEQLVTENLVSDMMTMGPNEAVQNIVNQAELPETMEEFRREIAAEIFRFLGNAIERFYREDP
jgi:hypothetical protein